MGFILKSIMGSLAVLSLPYFDRGIRIRDSRAGLKLFAVMVGINFILSLLLGGLLKITYWLTLGTGYVVVNCILLGVCADLVDGIEFDSFFSIFRGGLILSIFWILLSLLI